MATKEQTLYWLGNSACHYFWIAIVTFINGTHGR